MPPAHAAATSSPPARPSGPGGGRARLLRLLLAAALGAAGGAGAQEPPPDHGAANAAPGEAARAPEAASGDRVRLPATRVTRHEAPGQSGRGFTATAGAVTLTDPQDRPEADIAFVAYALEGGDAARRPVTFVVNGGPGAASAYLHLGALGPWRLPLDGASIAPSQPIGLVDNSESWLDFTDLVFVDPVGTGYSRLVEPDDRLRDRYLSIDGDVAALADFIQRWLAEHGRTASPKFFVGESYGGFRGPLLAEELQTEHGVALRGLVLLSPVLDFGWWSQPEHAPLPSVSLLPSLAASAMEAGGAFDADAQRAAEDYADDEYVADFLQGLGDQAAVTRMVDRVADLTGLDRDLVAQASGRIDGETFAREMMRDENRLVSVYDTTVSSQDPFPGAARPHAADPVLDAMTAPLTGAMIAHYAGTLDWRPERTYQLLNGGVSQAWSWGDDRGQPQAVDALRRVLALDPAFRVLVVHGYTDLVTPYFASDLILRQLPDFGAGRVRLETYRGGHMFYSRDESRRAFRDDVRALYEDRSG